MEEHKELYVPQLPLRFDKNEKLLIYKADRFRRDRRSFRLAMIVPSIFFYCGMRAIQKRSWWRILLWTIPCLGSCRIMSNAYRMLGCAIISIHLK